MTLYRNTLEGGANGTTITTGNSGGASGSAFSVVSRTGAAVLQYSSDHPSHGALGVKFSAAAGETAMVALGPLNSKQVAVQLDGLVLSSLPTGADITLIQFRGANNVQAAVQLKMNGKLEVFDDAGVLIPGMQTTGALVADLREYLIDARVEVGTGTTDGKFVLAYGPRGGPVTQTLTATTANLATTVVDEIRVLKPNSAGAITGAYADNPAAQDGVTAFITPAANAAPTANPGSTQTIDAGTTLNLVGSGTDPDGTIASYAWTVEDKPASASISITGATSANASVAAIPAGHYTFGLVVTDDQGLASSKATVDVFVRTATALPEDLVSNGGAYTIFGGSSTIPAALADASDATGIRSPDNPSGATVEYTVNPLAPGQVAFPYRARKTAATPARTITTSLVMGTTVIASHVLADADLSTSFQDYELTLNPTQLATVTGRNDLRLRHVSS